MGIKQTLDVINAMESEGIIERYAIAGAVASYNYIEPAVTEDLDLLVSLAPDSRDDPKSGLITLRPITSYLASKGYTDFRKEGIDVEGWPVQFLPVASELDVEALIQAEPVDISIEGIGSVSSRILRPEHLVAIALRVGRPKDLIRITQFLDAGAVDLGPLRDVLERHRLLPNWASFCAKSGTPDPLQVSDAHERP